VVDALIGMIPFIGFVMSAFAAIANRGVYGWPNRVSRLAFWLGTAFTVAFVVLMLNKSELPPQ
jgi:hypothetical protein